MENLQPGFRFYPTEEELVSFYLHNKLEGQSEELNRRMHKVIPVVNIYEFHPGDLPQSYQELCHEDPEQWFFFIPRQESEARGGRPKRLTSTGYWKATGSPSHVYSSNNCIIGEKRTMVFYHGRAPYGRKTDWKINEYKAIDHLKNIENHKAIGGEASSSSAAIAPLLRQEFSVCRVYKKSKCVRAFDRRPRPQDMVEMATDDHNNPNTHHESNLNHHENHDQISTSYVQNPPLMGVRESSSESSSSVDPGQASSQTNYENPNPAGVDADNDPLWEWEQFNLF